MAPSSLRAHDFESDRGCGREGLAQQRSNPVLLQDVHGELGEFFGVKARVVAHQDRGRLRLGFHVFRDGCHPPGARWRR